MDSHAITPPFTLPAQLHDGDHTVAGLVWYTLPVSFDKQDLLMLMQDASDRGVSDIKFQSTDHIFVYFKRRWVAVTRRYLEHNEVARILEMLYGPEAVSKIGTDGELDSAPEFNRFGQALRKIIRFRFNAVQARVGHTPRGYSITLRTIPEQLPSLSSLQLPVDLEKDLLTLAGTALFVGATGSGKTTLIAALLGNLACSDQALNILTYEQPVEFAFPTQGLGVAPLVSQVEIGNHLPSFSRAAPTAMRRKGDVLVIGETRDAQGAESFMELAVSGHAVFTTLHASTPAEAIYRIIGMFAPHIRSEAAAKLLSALHIICAQKLLRLNTGEVVAIRSWYTFTSDIKRRLTANDAPYETWSDLVREHTHALGQSFEAQLVPWVKRRQITVEQYRTLTQQSEAAAQAVFKEHA